MTSSISSASGRSPITLAAGFLGAFIVGSLAVQLVRSQTAAIQAGAAGVEPVIAGPAALWAPLASCASSGWGRPGPTGQPGRRVLHRLRRFRERVLHCVLQGAVCASLGSQNGPAAPKQAKHFKRFTF